MGSKIICLYFALFGTLSATEYTRHIVIEQEPNNHVCSVFHTNTDKVEAWADIKYVCYNMSMLMNYDCDGLEGDVVGIMLKRDGVLIGKCGVITNE